MGVTRIRLDADVEAPLELTAVSMEFIREEHAAGRLKALGEVTSQYKGMAPNNPALAPLYALAEELDIPISIHIGLTQTGGIYTAFPKYRAGAGDPLLLEEVPQASAVRDARGLADAG